MVQDTVSTLSFPIKVARKVAMSNWQDLVHSEGMLVDFFNGSMVGLAILDERLNYQMVNPYLAALNGTTIESHLGKHVREILGDVGRQIEPAIERVFVSAQPLPNLEVLGQLPTKAKAGHWTVSFFPMADSTGKVRRVGAMVAELEKDARLEPVHDTTLCPNLLLRSWKDIAQYMGTCVKTVQRWEHAFDLPVRRVQPGKGSVVLAFRNEIDEWLLNRTHDLNVAEPHRNSNSDD
jgi:hypothetical protein